jgi:hypothetical protein
MTSFLPIPVSEPFVYSTKKRNYAICGAGSGKTTHALGGMLIRDAILQPGYWEADIAIGQPYEIIVCEETAEFLRDIAYQTILQFLPEHLILRKHDARFIVVQGIHGKTIIYFRSYEQGANRIKSFKAVYRVYADEFYLMSEDFYAELLVRLSKRDGDLYCIGTPEGTAWVETMLDAEEKDPDSLVICWTSFDNPYVSHMAIDALRAKMTPELFARTFMATRGLFKGQIYDVPKNKILNMTCERIDGILHAKWDGEDEQTTYSTIIAGQDWGFAHNGCIITLGVYGSHVDVLDCVSAPTVPVLSPDPNSRTWVEIAKDQRQQYGVEIIYCGVDEPEHIADYEEAGLPAYKAKNSVNIGIETTACMVFSGNVRINAKCTSLIKGLQRYKRDEKGQPVKKDDDEVDALRYAIYSAVYDRVIDFDIKPRLAGSGAED